MNKRLFENKPNFYSSYNDLKMFFKAFIINFFIWLEFFILQKLFLRFPQLIVRINVLKNDLIFTINPKQLPHNKREGAI